MGFVAGVDLGGTHMQIGVIDESRAIVGRARGLTDPRGGVEAVVDAIARRVEQAKAQAGAGELEAVGLAAPGAVDHEQGLVIDAPNLRWRDVPAADILEQRLGTRVYLENDVNAAVFAEQRRGAGSGHDNIFGAWIGTGIGGGLVIAGEIYHGPCLTAGELGHVLIPGETPGTRQELEHLCSRTAIARRIMQQTNADAPPTAEQIADALHRGEEPTTGIVLEAAEALGQVIGSFVTVLSLGRVVLGGGLIESAGADLVDPITRAVRNSCWPDTLRSVEVLPTRLGPDAGLLGAALVARRRLMAQRDRDGA